MMYQESDPLILVTYGGDLFNNLAVTRTGLISVARAGCVNVVPLEESTFRRAKYISCSGHGTVQRDVVMQSAWLEVNALEHLAVLSTLGLQIYDSNGSEILYSNSCQNSKNSLGFAQGIAFVDDMLFVGNNLGYIKMFNVYSGYDLKASEIATTHAHDAAVLWICTTDSGIMVSSATNKTISIYDISQQKFNLIYCLLPSAVCTNVKIIEKLMILCHDDGTVVLYDISEVMLECSRPPTKMCHIQAHEAPIMGVDVAHNKLLTVSRDGWIKVWEVHVDSFKLSLLFENKHNAVLCGAGFTDATASSLCVAASDTNIVKYFCAPNRNHLNTILI